MIKLTHLNSKDELYTYRQQLSQERKQMDEKIINEEA